VLEWHKYAISTDLGLSAHAWLCVVRMKERHAMTVFAQSNKLLATLILVLLAFFALIAFKKVVGLHRVLNFYPLFFV
jgi:hypothetical protein